MSAIRLARAHAGRSKIVKFRGCYHGHADSMLVKAGSGVATLGLPDSPGVPEGAAGDTLLADFNDAASVADLFEHNAGEIAAVIVEPVAGNMGLIPPLGGFLRALRDLTIENEAILIFDEVMTGFRVGPTGAQGVYGITPDLSTFGKVIGGGLPVGAFGGRADIMDSMAPAGPVYQAGTLSGNPIAMRAGLTTLEQLTDKAVYTRLEETSRAFVAAIESAAAAADVPVQTSVAGGMFGFCFTDGPVTDWDSAVACDRDRFRSFFHAMLDAGVYLPPSPFEACFVSTAHTASDVDRFAAAATEALATT
jgi:glutamate-1-semialdehyde 2,1-aminomutase